MAEIVAETRTFAIRLAPSGGAKAPFSGAVTLRLTRTTDLLSGGKGVIRGTVFEKGTPNLVLKRKVRVHRESNGEAVQQTWSDAETGAYTFVGLDPRVKYTVIAYDYKHNYRAVVADNLTPEVPT